MQKHRKTKFYFLLCVVLVIFLQQCIGLYLYSAQYQYVSTFFSFAAVPENTSEYYEILEQSELVYWDNMTPTLSQIIYYPEQGQIVFGVITSRFSDDHFNVCVKSPQGLELGLSYKTGSHKFLGSEITDMIYQLNSPLLPNVVYCIELYFSQKLIGNATIRFA